MTILIKYFASVRPNSIFGLPLLLSRSLIFLMGEFQKVMQPRKRPPGTSVAVSMEGRELSDPDGFLPLLSSASVFLPVFFTLDAPLIARKTLCACTRDMHTITRTHKRTYQLFYI
jgi:hypothetical protein